MTTVHDPSDFICGDSWEFPGLLQNNGAAIDLTGATLTWKLDNVDGTVNYLVLSIGNGIDILEPALGTMLVTVSPTQSSAITPGTYRDYLRVTLAEGDVFTEWTGIIRVASNPA